MPPIPVPATGRTLLPEASSFYVHPHPLLPSTENREPRRRRAKRIDTGMHKEGTWASEHVLEGTEGTYRLSVWRDPERDETAGERTQKRPQQVRKVAGNRK